MIDDLKQIMLDTQSTPEQMKKAKELLTALTPKPTMPEPKPLSEWTDAELKTGWSEAFTNGYSWAGQNVVNIGCELANRRRSSRASGIENLVPGEI